MLKVVVYLFLASILAYLLFYPFIRKAVNRKKLFKWFLIAYAMAAVLTTISSYLMKPGKPEAFNEGVRLVQQDKAIVEQIGGFRALKYNKQDLPAETDNPAELRFQLEGSKGIMLIESTVAKNEEGKWYLVDINKAILIEKY